MNELKGEIRRQIEALRKALPREEVVKRSAGICRQVMSLPCYREAETVFFYQAIGNEVSLDLLIEDAYAQGKRVLFPVCEGRGQMRAYQVHHNAQLRTGRYGITEPDPERCEEIPPDKIDLVIVPGVAFDRQGNRLGRGAGYYDRFLAKASKAVRVGVGYSEQIVEEVPVTDEDIPMHMILFE